MSDYPIREAFQMFYLTYRERHSVTPEQESAAQCIMGCKTGTYGFTESTCPDCGHRLIHYASCGNRNCPNCQGTKPQQWVSTRNSELIEGLPYFHVVMTVPHDLNPLFLASPAPMYSLLLKSSSVAIKEVSSRPENLGAVPGTVSVLHSWSQTLELHPHVHMLVAGGGLINPMKFIRVRNNHFFCPEAHLAGAFREAFLSGLKALRDKEKLLYTGSAGFLRNHYSWEEFLTKLYKIPWNVFLKETFNGNGNAVEYLARYAYRTAISNSRILSVDARGVTIKWKDYRNGSEQKSMLLSGEEFIRRFLMHVLPKSFSRIRYGGYLSNAHRKKCLAQIRRLTGTKPQPDLLANLKIRDRIFMLFKKDIHRCPICSGTMYTSGRCRGEVMLC